MTPGYKMRRKVKQEVLPQIETMLMRKCPRLRFTRPATLRALAIKFYQVTYKLQRQGRHLHQYSTPGLFWWEANLVNSGIDQNELRRVVLPTKWERGPGGGPA